MVSKPPSGRRGQTPRFPEGPYELLLFSEVLTGHENFLLLLDDFKLSFELLQVFFEAKDFHTLKKKKKNLLLEGKTTSHFGECNEKTLNIFS